MTLRELIQDKDWYAAGEEMHALAARLFPICRSITGEGVRKSLAILSERIPLEVREVPSGTQAFDWTVPPEWNIRDAYIKDGSGRRVVDFQKCNLHVVSYSVPMHERMPLGALRPHLHTLPEQPDLIPYRTAYYAQDWGFCLSHRAYESLRDEEYEVCIDSTLEPGSLTYAECVLGGETGEETLLSCNICHPSLANDNLSGVTLLALLARALQAVERRFTYRLLFLPATIGAIVWLSRNEASVERIRHGLIAANLGDHGRFRYKRSRLGDAEVDQAAEHVLRHLGVEHEVRNFAPYGYDERQFCSPGFNLPVGSLTRTPFAEYPEYHTSADNLDFITPAALGESLRAYMHALAALEANRRYMNTNPKCEPQLGKRGLYGNLGGMRSDRTGQMAMLWVLNLSDGAHSLLDIADRAQMSFERVEAAAQALRGHGLLEPLPDNRR